MLPPRHVAPKISVGGIQVETLTLLIKTAIPEIALEVEPFTLHAQAFTLHVESLVPEIALEVEPFSLHAVTFTLQSFA